MSARAALPRSAIAALFLERQHLGRPRTHRLTAASLVRFAEDVGGIQLDSINVLERAHLLTLWSRFGAYDRATFERLVYRRRLLFEYWAHAACLVPTTQFPMWRRAMLDYEVRHTGWTTWLRKHGPTLKRVEREFREHGPLGNADFANERPGKRPAGWWAWKPEAHAMDYLWKKGVLGVHSRVHFQRRLDLIERLLPAALALEPLSREAFRRWHVRRSLHAMGAASTTDLRMYLSYPRAIVTERRATLKTMLGSGEIVEVAVEGERAPWLALAEDLPVLEATARRRVTAIRGTTFLSPFDSFLWHRERTKTLFGFDYRIEVYTPGPRRVHGYYSLPILHDGMLIGRLDAKNQREAKRLEVKHVHFESWFAEGGAPPADGRGCVTLEPALAGTAETLGSLAAFVGAERITLGRVSPAKLAKSLQRALAAATKMDG